MLEQAGRVDRPLTEAEVRRLLRKAMAPLPLAGKRVLAIIPDSTRTAPIPLLYRLLDEVLGGRVAALDYLVALGTHQPMDDAALSLLLGTEVRDGRAGAHRVFNHRWERPETFVTAGVLPAGQVHQLSGGRLALDVPVRLNRLLWAYDHLLVCGPIFPHEVVGFSGGNKYFIPGVAGREIINVTHWLGALLTSRAIIGIPDTPVRRMIDEAAALIPTPRTCLAMVMHGEALHGLYIGPMKEAWQAATALSAKLDIVYVDKPFRRVLSIVPEMYDDLWTGAKGMYKLEPAIADGGEVVIYAPHIREISYTHGAIIAKVGYHVRDYFVKQWNAFKDYPWGVLAHSTHLRGDGWYDAARGVEHPRIQVTLATRIPRQVCEQIGLGYLDPDMIDLDAWRGREAEGIVVIERAGEVLYRLRHDAPSHSGG